MDPFADAPSIVMYGCLYRMIWIVEEAVLLARLHMLLVSDVKLLYDVKLQVEICGCRRFRDEWPQNAESFGVGSPE